MSVGRPPQIKVSVHEDRTAEGRCDRGFMRIRRYVLKNHYSDGTTSEPYPYDVVERDAIDAVAVVLYDTSEAEPRVCIRSALRPPLAFRPQYALPIEAREESVIWEIPAGLIEPEEKGNDGILACAARETLEETGIDAPASTFEMLGSPASLSPGVMAETVYFVVGRVDAATRGEPTSDGSPVEARAEVRFVTLDEAFSAIARGEIADIKTELGLRRFRDFWRQRTE